MAGEMSFPNEKNGMLNSNKAWVKCEKEIKP